MKIFQFTITGNHKSPTGNAVPKLKMTGRQHWTKKAKEYVDWKEHVVYSFLSSREDAKSYAFNVSRHGKPFTDTEYAFMMIRIHWANKAHGDPENIFGSIADALFANDKNLDCLTFSSPAEVRVNGKPQGKVVVRIHTFEGIAEKVQFMKSFKNSFE